MTAVVVPWQMSSGADWPLLLALVPILAFLFYLERRPTQRQIIAVIGVVLVASMAVFADELVMADYCALVESWWERLLLGCVWR